MTFRTPGSVACRRRAAGGRRSARGALLRAGLLAGLASAAFAIDYQPPPFVELFGLSDLVVLGRVEEIASDVLRLEVDEVLRGAEPGGSLEVVRVERWPSGDPRRGPYEAGQEFVLLLRAEPPGDTARWRIIGLGGEGELPVESDWVYLEGRPLPIQEPHRRLVHAGEIEAQRFAVGCFVDALRRYGECFRWRPGVREEDPPRIERRCGDGVLSDYRGQSGLHDHLAAETLRRIESLGAE